MTPIAARADAVELPHAKERAAWAKIGARFKTAPNAERDRSGKVVRIGVSGLRIDKDGKGMARVVLDPATGHVVEVVSDRAGFTNDEFKLFADFSELKKLTLWHNSNFHDKKAPFEDYDASGLAHLQKLAHLERVTLAGGAFGDAGMKAAAQLPKLKYLGMWHVRVSDAGMKHLHNHPTLEVIRVGPFWGKLMTDESLAHLATCPRIRSIKFGETFLTYENGLKHLLAAKGTLNRIDLENCLIDPKDVERLRAELPGIKLQWGGLAAAGKVLRDSNWHRAKATKWMPKGLVDRALSAAKDKP